ncbi:MAG: deoxyribodipyrimidine photo-lyase [Halodesulfurarchaeum sp.]|nr:deoxyribodipyrimidine photo-lyase [Halodesulfurarchaeum sp.]
MPNSPDVVFWHRRDLRTVDNRGLQTAAAAGSVLPVYVIDPDLVSMAGPARTGFFVASLASLQETYREMGTDLLVRDGDPTVVIPELADEFDVDTLVWNRDYSQFATRRDRSVTENLPDAVTAESVPDMTYHEPGSILTNKGEYYSVFSYYYKKWADKEQEDAIPQPASDSFIEERRESVRSIVESPGESLPLPAGRSAALERLHRFTDGPIYEYATARDVPAKAGTSRLSQDLAFGLLGIREVLEDIRAATNSASSDTKRESVEEFRRQLAWRDFYVQVLAAHPETVVENFKDFENPIQWRENPEHLEAWKSGKTGYPIVDAGMRQLRSEAYMHNRVRMLVASFLTKDLQLDWRKGYRHFRRHLLDHETANDVGGWQWAASTGTDAQPYFRVFNPMTQGERYDPEAAYITTYVSELEGVDPEKIHNWHELEPDRRAQIAPEYPDPIVDHGARRESAIEMFERARGNDD